MDGKGKQLQECMRKSGSRETSGEREVAWSRVVEAEVVRIDLI